MASTARFGESEAVIGPFLAEGQSISHAFSLVNPFEEAWTIERIEVMSACCSSVVEAPRTVAPHDQFEVRVRYDSGHDTIRRGLAFEMVGRRGEGELVSVPLVLIVEMLGTRELVTVEEPPAKNRPGEEARWAFRLVTRHPEDVPLQETEVDVVATPGLSAWFAGTPSVAKLQHGITEITRELKVEALDTSEIGERWEEIQVVGIENGSVLWNHSLRWVVQPMVEVQPSALILDRGGEVRRTVVLSSADAGPFQVLSIDHPLLVEVAPSLPNEPTPVHQLSLTLAADQLAEGATSDLVIHTDHPAQAEAVVTLFKVGQEGGGE